MLFVLRCEFAVTVRESALLFHIYETLMAPRLGFLYPQVMSRIVVIRSRRGKAVVLQRPRAISCISRVMDELWVFVDLRHTPVHAAAPNTSNLD